jgi:hypothetical protein
MNWYEFKTLITVNIQVKITIIQEYPLTLKLGWAGFVKLRPKEGG